MATKQKQKKEVGRPTKYTPGVIRETKLYLEKAVPENMAIPTVEGLALRLKVSKDSLYQWAKIYPEFSYALGELKMKQKEALVQTGIFGGKEINSTIVALLLKVNHQMIDKQEIILQARPFEEMPDEELNQLIDNRYHEVKKLEAKK